MTLAHGMQLLPCVGERLPSYFLSIYIYIYILFFSSSLIVLHPASFFMFTFCFCIYPYCTVFSLTYIHYHASPAPFFVFALLRGALKNFFLKASHKCNMYNIAIASSAEGSAFIIIIIITATNCHAITDETPNDLYCNPLCTEHSITNVKCRDDTVPKTVDTRRHCKVGLRACNKLPQLPSIQV